jgi:hypothetical protein
MSDQGEPDEENGEIADLKPTTEEQATVAASGEQIDADDDPEVEIEGPNSA